MRYRFAVPYTDLVNTPLGAALAGTLTRSDYRRTIENLWQESDHLAVVKPDRMLGAPWMSDFVSQGLIVSLCADCCTRYGRWWAEYDYLPNLGELGYADCDGCSTKLVKVTQFRPEAQETQT